jgi:ankyrin repeat protein
LFFFIKTPLLSAAQNGHPEIVRLLLSQPTIDPNVVSHGTVGVLDWVLSSEDPDIVRLVLTCPKFSRTAKSCGLEWIKQAIALGNPEMTELLLELGILGLGEIDNTKATALHIACDDDAVAVVRLLLAKGGVDVNARDAEGKTPLHYAVVAGSMDTVKVLADAPGIDLSIPDNGGNPPLRAAYNSGQVAISQFLKAKGATAPRRVRSAPTAAGPV